MTYVLNMWNTYVLTEITTWANVEESQVEQRVGKPESPDNKPKERVNTLFIQMLFTNK